MEETITTTYFESTRDYSIWIDTELLTLQPEDEGIGMDIFVKPNVDDRRYEVCVYFGGWLDYTFEQAVDAVQENMILNYGFAEAFDVEGTFTDLSACGLYATVDDITILEYIVDMGNGAYYIHIQFPNEAAEGFGSRVIQMLASFEVFPCE